MTTLDEMPDWPPRASAIGLPEGEKRRGGTGQLWQVREGRWVRLKALRAVPENGNQGDAA